jgi:hypothetical protein
MTGYKIIAKALFTYSLLVIKLYSKQRLRNGR